MQKTTRSFASLNAICCQPSSVIVGSLKDSGQKTETSEVSSEVPSEVPREVLVLFHGYGASPQDLLPLAQPLAQFLPTASQVFLEAPEPYPDASILGARAWFPLQELSIMEITKGLQAIEKNITEAIKAISNAYQMPFSRIALLGFSQGGMVALQATLSARYNKVLPSFLASVGIATRAVETKLEEETNTIDATKTPILMIHGDADEVVPLQQGLNTAKMLRAQGYPLKWHERKGMGHEIDQETLQIAGEFLAQHAKIKK